MAGERHSEALPTLSTGIDGEAGGVVAEEAAEHAADAVVSPALERFLGHDGLLALAMPGFESREGQERMMRAVASALATQRPLLVEAGTGTGKSLGYLLPALLSGHRTIVATGTKTLQDQLWLQQVPFLRDRLGLRFSAAVLKGRTNYLCKLLLAQAEALPELPLSQREALGRISAWAETTETGDRGELEADAATLEIWRGVAADEEQCLGRSCPHHDTCFLVQARRRAEGADLVIVNHHLLLADLALGLTREIGLLPRADAVVIDEAHHLEDVAAQAFGEQLSSVRMQRFAADLRRALSRAGALTTLREGLIEALLRDVAALWIEVGAAPGGGRTAWHGALGAAGEEALARCDNHLLALGGLARELGANDAALGRLAERADALRELAWRLLCGPSEAEGGEAEVGVRWLEEGPRTTFLRAAPISVARPLQRSLLSRFERVVLTSATLAEAGDFGPVAARLGLEGPRDGLVVPSPFDFARQGLLFVPADLPDPREAGHHAASVALLRDLVSVTEGKALLLFTSWRAMREAWAALAPSWPWPTLIQGEAGKEALLARFRSTPDAVLFATQTFWEGVDIPGQALSLLVIDRLPFESPGDPLVDARLQALRRAGRNPFRELQVPRAATALRQGLGRLIRHRDDRGIAAILDPRLWRASYGATLLAALPPFEVTADLERVQRFWQNLTDGDPDGPAP